MKDFDEIIKLEKRTELIYEEDYYIMALRNIFNGKNKKVEEQFLSEVYRLKEIYQGSEIHDYLFYDKIV